MAAALLSCACTIAPPASEHAKPELLAEVPIEIRHLLPTVDIFISGKPFRLFLDLGDHQAITLLTSELSHANVRFLEGSNKFRNSSGQILESCWTPH